MLLFENEDIKHIISSFSSSQALADDCSWNTENFCDDVIEIIFTSGSGNLQDCDNHYWEITYDDGETLKVCIQAKTKVWFSGKNAEIRLVGKHPDLNDLGITWNCRNRSWFRNP